MQRNTLHRFPRLLTLLFGAALILAFPACDSGDGDGDGGGGGGSSLGNVDVTVSGDYEESFSGSAYFTVDDTDGKRTFAIGLIGGTLIQTQTSQVVVFVREGDRPGTGTYTLGEDAGEFFGGYTNLEGTDGDFLDAISISSESGTITITSSSGDRVNGNFSFTGQVLDLSNPTGAGTATVAGSFSAEFLDPNDVPNTGGF